MSEEGVVLEIAINNVSKDVLQVHNISVISNGKFLEKRMAKTFEMLRHHDMIPEVSTRNVAYSILREQPCNIHGGGGGRRFGPKNLLLIFCKK